MHRFWEVDEMIRLLATHLVALDKPSVAALACSSKLLEEAALDPLWERLDKGPRPLMRCLPQDTWEIRDSEFVFLRCPSAKEWHRFSSYARRVHALTYSVGDPRVSSAAFQVLSMMYTPTPDHYLFPRLRSIDWAMDKWEVLPFLRLFLNPEMIKFRVGFPDNTPHPFRVAAMSTIPAENLTELVLDRSNMRDDLTRDVLIKLLDEASDVLRSVSLDGELPMAVIEKLLQLPDLRRLNIQLPGTRISPPEVVFPSLETLGVSYREAGSWLHLLQNIPNPALRELHVVFSGSSPEYLQTLFSSLLDANIVKTLASLKCSPENKIPLTSADIRPLLYFRRLTILELNATCSDGQCASKLDDLIIPELAMALPHLTSLILGDTPCKASTSDPTFTSLVALSTNCVNLDYLRLHFNTSDLASRDTHTNTRTRASKCKLRTLCVGSQPLPSDPNDILLVTFAIIYMFPHLETIVTDGGGWEQVERNVELSRKASGIVSLPTVI